MQSKVWGACADYNTCIKTCINTDTTEPEVAILYMDIGMYTSKPYMAQDRLIRANQSHASWLTWNRQNNDPCNGRCMHA